MLGQRIDRDLDQIFAAGGLDRAHEGIGQGAEAGLPEDCKDEGRQVAGGKAILFAGWYGVPTGVEERAHRGGR